LKNLQIQTMAEHRRKHKLIIIQEEKSCSHGTALFDVKFLTENKTTTLLIFYRHNALFQTNYTKQRYKPTQIDK
jgi:hypothetical protein